MQMFRPSLMILAVLVLCFASVTGVSTAFGQSNVKVVYFNVEVPLDHRRPKGETIKLSVARISKKPSKSNPPLIYLSGGPGETSIRLIAKRYENGGWRFELISAALNDRDVIVFDQRGSGQSGPNLRCRFKVPVLVRPPYDFAAHADAGACAAEKYVGQLPIEKGKLQFFNSWQSARDIDSIRQHLKLEHVALLGQSYGSHLALAYIRDFGEHVRRAVLSAVEGSDHTYKLSLPFDLALDRTDQHRRKIGLPPVKPLVNSLLARVNREGTIAVSSFDGYTGRVEPVEINAYEAQRYVLRVRASSLYRSWASGDLTGLSVYARGWRVWRGFSAMTFAMDCASGASPQRFIEIERQKETALVQHINFLPRKLCDALGAPMLPPSFRAPFQSDVPVLLMTGDLDYKTPTENAVETVNNFANAFVVISRSGNHAMCVRPKCIALYDAFLSGQRTPHGIEKINVN